MPGPGGPFAPGESGNVGGRPKGARSKSKLALEAILNGDAEAILRKAIELAKEGDPTSMRLCLDRMMPARKDRLITFALPVIEGPADVTRATVALLQGVADGDITPSEAAELGKLVEAHIRAIETSPSGSQPLRATALDRDDDTKDDGSVWPAGNATGFNGKVPPAIVPVLMLGIASRLGGYPKPRDLQQPYRSDVVSDGLAREIGYRDYEDMDREAQSDVHAWGARMEAGFDALLETEGLVRGAADDAQIFAGLVRILDAVAAAKATGGVNDGWGDVPDRLNEWIKHCRLSPEVVRAEART